MHEISSLTNKKKRSFTSKGLPAGPYAVVVVHDVNANGEIDHTLLRLPAEPLGFSRGFRLGLLSGMPTFEKLSFEAVAGCPRCRGGGAVNLARHSTHHAPSSATVNVPTGHEATLPLGCPFSVTA